MKTTLMSCVTLLLMSTAASATPIVYTFNAIGSGTVGTTPFTDRTFRIDIPGDTTPDARTTHPAPFPL